MLISEWGSDSYDSRPLWFEEQICLKTRCRTNLAPLFVSRSLPPCSIVRKILRWQRRGISFRCYQHQWGWHADTLQTEKCDGAALQGQKRYVGSRRDTLATQLGRTKTWTWLLKWKECVTFCDLHFSEVFKTCRGAQVSWQRLETKMPDVS